MLHGTEGIVLKSMPYGEADLIVTYFTSDMGIHKFFAKSPRKIKSRFGSSLEPLTHSRIAFWAKERTALPKLTQSDIIHPFHTVRGSLSSFLKVTEMIELVLHFIPERDENRDAYMLFLATLFQIENHGDEPVILNHFKVKFLKHVGFAPKLDMCGRCGNDGKYFFIADGSVLCNRCAAGTGSAMKISVAVARLYNDLLTWDTAKIHRIRPSQTLLADLSAILASHIHFILSKPLNCSKLAYSQ